MRWPPGALVPGPSTSPLDSMRAFTLVPASSRRVLILIWLSWATLLFVGVLLFLSSSMMCLPHTVELLVVLSGAITFVGGCLGSIVLISAARTRQAIVAGAIPTFGNLAYLWRYVEAVYLR